MLEIGHDAAGQEILRAKGTFNLSLTYIVSYRLIMGCAGLNLSLAILSIVALVLVVKRRFEIFSFTILLMILAISTASGTLQAGRANPYALSYEHEYAYLAGENLIVFFMATCSSILLYATAHCIFSLQYLCTSLVVPLYFERKIRLDTHYYEMVPSFDRKIKLYKWVFSILQIVSFLVGATYVIYKTTKWVSDFEQYKNEYP